MTRQKVITIVGVVLALTCLANAGLAQAQATSATQPSGDQSQSAAALAQEATQPVL